MIYCMILHDIAHAFSQDFTYEFSQPMNAHSENSFVENCRLCEFICDIYCMTLHAIAHAFPQPIYIVYAIEGSFAKETYNFLYYRWSIAWHCMTLHMHSHNLYNIENYRSLLQKSPLLLYCMTLHAIAHAFSQPIVCRVSKNLCVFIIMSQHEFSHPIHLKISLISASL